MGNLARVNWSGSRSALDRPDIASSPDAPSPFRFPSLISVASNLSNDDPKRRISIHQQHKAPMADPNGFIKQNFSSNMISTCKYSLLTFIPKNLYEQFRGIANFYFLSLVVLQVFDMFATVPIAVAAAPIVLIVLVTAIKDGIEDIRRHQSDARVNQSTSFTLHNDVNYNYSKKRIFKKGKEIVAKDYLDETSFSPKASKAMSGYLSDTNVKWVEIEWQNIKVGDFVLLRNDDAVPADLMIVSTSESENLCFLETKNLDGETNLKVKKGLPELSHVKSPHQCLKMKCIIETELPHPNLYLFNGVITLKTAKLVQQSIPINSDSILLRGCTLRNTAWAIGIVLCTGVDTKIMQNSGATPAKRSRVDRQINPQVLEFNDN
jgi:phospholipid-translocating ATPase